MLYETLFFALGLRRPHKGTGVEKLARHIEAAFKGKTFRDEVGNVHLDLRGGASRTLFVAHLDTVHRGDGVNKIDRSKKGWLKAVKDSQLGADDGAGVALLCHLASSGVPGYYVFTQGEECGGIGATFLANQYADLLREFDRSIAFDRKDVWSVITHQGWSGRCCSDAFADALSAGLSAGDLIYAPDATGVYTDTAEFVDCIPECTNVSVGYYHEHSDRECLDLLHFAALAKAVVALDWEALPTERVPMEDVFSIESASATQMPYSKRDFEFIDAIESARAGSNSDLALMIAARLVGEKDADSGVRSIARMRISEKLLDAALDDLDDYGWAVACDMLADELISRRYH